SIVKRPATVRRRAALASAKQASPQPRVMAASMTSNRMAAIDSGVGQRITCKHGELARECLARYR
ncbi:MAG TPA: hypothetical protein VFS95_08075, partial [Telluria sp.]|nr:hypothetical protein [Telluria sp.]